jgi:hypothetical protein
MGQINDVQDVAALCFLTAQYLWKDVYMDLYRSHGPNVNNEWILRNLLSRCECDTCYFLQDESNTNSRHNNLDLKFWKHCFENSLQYWWNIYIPFSSSSNRVGHVPDLTISRFYIEIIIYFHHFPLHEYV